MTQASVTDPEIDLSLSGIQSHIFRQTAQLWGKKITHERNYEETLDFVSGRCERQMEKLESGERPFSLAITWYVPGSLRYVIIIDSPMLITIMYGKCY